MKLISTKNKIILFFLCCCFTFATCAYFVEKPFDSKLWIEGNLIERGRMEKDLRSREIVTNKSRIEVIEILGKPDSESEKTMTYKIDKRIRFGNHPWLYNLTIVFGGESKTAETIFVDD